MTPVSVVVPCWNAEEWIGEALRSALDQAGVRVEVVVVDDGSTDGTRAAIRRLADPRVRVISQVRQGASRARNVGTAASRAPYLQYLDADDVLLPDALRVRAAALESSGADVAYSDWVRYERASDGRFADGEAVARELGPRPELDLVTDFWWPPGALLYRRAIVERIGAWREDLPIIQDARFQLDAALAGARFVRVPGVGLRYRVHGPESLSRRDPRAFVDDCYRNGRDLHERWAREGSLDEGRRRALLRVYDHAARRYHGLDRARFREVLGHLSALDPRYRPESPRSLRLASTLMGYPAALFVAGAWRRLKRLAAR